MFARLRPAQAKPPITEHHVIAEIRNPEGRLIQMEETAWNRVVTEFNGDTDRVVTAFPQSNDPREGGWQR